MYIDCIGLTTHVKMYTCIGENTCTLMNVQFMHNILFSLMSDIMKKLISWFPNRLYSLVLRFCSFVFIGEYKCSYKLQVGSYMYAGIGDRYIVKSALG